MAEIKKSLKDYGLQILRELLSPREDKQPKKASLEDVTLDDLRREKIRFEQEERKILEQVRQLEDQKRRLFDESVRAGGDREIGVAARKIKDLDGEAANKDSLLQAISKQMRIINGLIQVKERYRVLAETGISGILKDIDLQDLIMYVDKASVDGEFHMDKFNELLKVFEAGSAGPAYEPDKDEAAIRAAILKAREAGDDAAIDREYGKLKERPQPKQKEGPEDMREES